MPFALQAKQPIIEQYWDSVALNRSGVATIIIEQLISLRNIINSNFIGVSRLMMIDR